MAQVSGLGQRTLRVKTREQLSSAGEIADEFVLATSAQQLPRRTVAASTASASMYQPVISAASVIPTAFSSAAVSDAIDKVCMSQKVIIVLYRILGLLELSF